ncbi:MAG: hypothetical protein IT463_12410, partial [Planctomycetes bacterium]|nr:hypothetical protein [Planctomycetota bacterium]
TREITQKKRELQKMLKSLEGKEEQYSTALSKAQKDLDTEENTLRQMCTQKKLRTLEQVKGDKNASAQLLLVGEIQKRLKLTEKKLETATDTKTQLSISIKRLANQEELSKLAESKEELAMLDQLLTESRNVLEEKTDLGEIAKLTEEQAADDWFRENFGK